METRVTLRPGKRGTRKWLNKYGDRLVCIRYRYDTNARRRFTTVELVVDESPWDGRPKASRNRLVDIKVRYDETELRERVKGMGGTWDPQRRVWTVGFAKVQALGLEDRIIAPRQRESGLCL